MKKGCIVFLILAVIIAATVIFAGPELINRGMRLIYPKKYEDIVKKAAGEFNLEENLIYAVIKTESGFDEKAESHAGAQGLMQLTPDTFQWMAGRFPPESGGGIFDPEANIHCGSALLRVLLDHFGSLDVALAAYNAGMGNVSQWLENGDFSSDGESLHTIPYPETEAYVEKVKKALEAYNKLY